MYDIIVVGGGAAGCVIAGKLSAADPSLKILILEAGPHSHNVPQHVQPARFIRNVQQPQLMDPKSICLHVAQPSEALLGRKIVMRQGSVLGGGSSVNFMVYVRPSASDYDAWEVQFGNKGWGSKDLIPLLKEVEAYHPFEEGAPVGPVHGDKGPVKISFAKKGNNVGEQFLDVVRQYDKARPIGDWNDFGSGNKYGRWAKYIDPRTGRRSDTAHAFIYNQPPNPNLVVETEKRVVRVLFEGTKAVGVEYVGEEKNEDGSRVVQQAYASKLVVISAGSIASPAILERSGIGGAAVLKANDIAQLVDLPGVGENYMDHSAVFSVYRSAEEADTMDAVYYGGPNELSSYESEWKSSGTGPLSRNGLDAGCKLRPTPDELKELGPAFQQRWDTFYKDYPDKPVMLGASMAACGSPAGVKEKMWTAAYYSAYPSSTGCVHIAGGRDPFAPLDYHPGYLDKEEDVAMFRWAYKHLREIARRMPFYRGEYEERHPKFPEGSAAACNLSREPVAIDAPKLVYTKEDDEAIDRYHRTTMGPAWHPAGTCAMKPREQGGVLDSRLNVYGTTNLKVADVSVCPENVGANTYSTALAVGLKATVIIAEELGIKLRN
ncbi:alcohol oxidase AOX1 [Coprinopsis cinerea okayama7|uniref:pyranose dehydrogenase (acceptor) n=1 Tax=Coprinopsis cinerea (strain Okayama-7 / 130 / ATCC MYA-4618 / FGSC 9003) TaxID=240176 RepID=A8P437_COPC7|nr:alcohol oxidase AOX1 [Coprinopsis cinerea okayama7\|eukprot:XP_001838671.1 alcohol oxidase AOX1 [Coprinopsis cinerea okayama7\